MASRALPLLALIAVAAGCGQAAARTETPPSAQSSRVAVIHHPAPPHGYRWRTIGEDGLRIALPIGWMSLGQRDAVYPGTLQTLTRYHRDFLQPLVALESPDSPLKLFAFDRVPWRGRATTMMVAQASYGDPGPYDRWAPKMVRSLARVAGSRYPVRGERLRLQAGPALRASYGTPAGYTVTHYIVAGRSGLWAVTFTTPRSQLRHYAASFTKVASTLELTAPVGGPIFAAPAPPA